MLDDSKRTFADAFAIAQKVFRYTNHTVMPEALEKWDCHLVEELLPELYPIIVQINEAMLTELYQKNVPLEQIAKMKIIQNGMVHMAHLAVYASSYTNGVAAIHTQILKDTVLADWYKVWPERFLNETNGITQRRWLALCNQELSGLLTELAGSDAWMTDLKQLKALETKGTPDVLERFCSIKQTKKQQLADFIAAKEGITIDPNSIFDIQIKRLHEYKRQLLNAFSILYLYEGIKDGSIQNFTPTTFLFGAKSAPGYRRAKAIIKFINEVGKLIANDPDVNQLIKVVFVSNYNVSYAEKLVAAADVSEQISTAGTEASGTGNMKLMLNGAITLETLDGANIEIGDAVGSDNILIFGMKTEEVNALKAQGYHPGAYYEQNPIIHSCIDRMYAGINGCKFAEVADSLKNIDPYMVLADFDSYAAIQKKSSELYQDTEKWTKMSLHNIAGAGIFSADRAVNEYARDIWGVK